MDQDQDETGGQILLLHAKVRGGGGGMEGDCWNTESRREGEY